MNFRAPYISLPNTNTHKYLSHAPGTLGSYFHNVLEIRVLTLNIMKTRGLCLENPVCKTFSTFHKPHFYNTRVRPGWWTSWRTNSSSPVIFQTPFSWFIVKTLIFLSYSIFNDPFSWVILQTLFSGITLQTRFSWRMFQIPFSWIMFLRLFSWFAFQTPFSWITFQTPFSSVTFQTPFSWVTFQTPFS